VATWDGEEEYVPAGPALLRPDAGRPGAYTLQVDGVDQSYVDSNDPTYLDFPYMQRLGWVVDAIARASAPIRVLHLGAGALTIPRYVAATRPGSLQHVIEHDKGLLSLVLRKLPLPPDEPIELVIGDARTTTEALPDEQYDLIIGDVYRAAQMPGSVASVEFAEHVARLLRPGGQYAVNVVDMPPLAFSRRQAATLGAVFGDVCLIAEANVLRGRRFGNVVFVAAASAGALPVERLVQKAIRGPFPARLLHGEALAEFAAGARPVGDAEAEDSPVPEPPLFA
jgi:spermidine synthase